MRSAETALGIIHDRGKSAVLEDTGEPGAPKWRMPGSGRGGWKSAGNGNSLAAYSTSMLFTQISSMLWWWAISSRFRMVSERSQEKVC